MIRSASALAALTALLVTAACTSDPLTVQAELDVSYGFDSGLEGWAPVTRAVDGTVTVAQTGANASEGSGSVMLSFADASGQGVGLLVADFDLEPNQAYDVDLFFDFASADTQLGAQPWTLRAVAGATEPTATGALVDVGDTGGAAAGASFEARTASVVGTTDGDGNLWVAIGVSQDAGGVRTYHLDELRVTFTRR